MTPTPPTIAWFRTEQLDRPTPIDEVPALLDALSSHFAIDVIDEERAYDFVWRNAQRRYDACVYELDDTPAHQFIWAYLFHYPGVLWLRADILHQSRALMLQRAGRLDDYETEAAFNVGAATPIRARTLRSISYCDSPMLRAPVCASKLVVVPHAKTSRSLQGECPAARIRHVPTGVPAPGTGGPRGDPPPSSPDDDRIVFGVLGPSCPGPIERAMQRAVGSGAAARMIVGPADVVAAQSDVMIALDWPPAGRPLTGALVAMASAKPVVVFEGEVTADWPALDPQTWRPRGLDNAPPLVVSIDPRDEEHSLVLAIRRLAADATLRGQLGAAGHAWWRSHATIAHAAEAWNRVLGEAQSIPAPPRPADWPPHLTEDGTALARKVLAEFGRPLDLPSTTKNTTSA